MIALEFNGHYTKYSKDPIDLELMDTTQNFEKILLLWNLMDTIQNPQKI